MCTEEGSFPKKKLFFPQKWILFYIRISDIFSLGRRRAAAASAFAAAAAVTTRLYLKIVLVLQESH